MHEGLIITLLLQFVDTLSCVYLIISTCLQQVHTPYIVKIIHQIQYMPTSSLAALLGIKVL